MNKQLKRKWIRALRSGDYRRGTEMLVNAAGTKFCCLGVLADIQGCTWSDDFTILDPGEAAGLIPTLPNARKPLVARTRDMLPEKYLGRDTQNQLMQMNDGGWSFKRIAAWIEKTL